MLIAVVERRAVAPRPDSRAFPSIPRPRDSMDSSATSTPTPAPVAPAAPRRSLVRDIVGLILTGSVLGIVSNAVLQQSGSPRALPWIKHERALVPLSDVTPVPAVTKAPADSATHAVAPPPVTAPAATVVPPVTKPVATAPTTKPPMPAKNTPAPATKPPTSGVPATASPTPTATSAAPKPWAPATAPSASPAQDVPVIPDAREPVEVGLPVVQKLHAANAALFVDARSAEEYAEGHIAGAVNLPFDDVFKDPARAKSLASGGRPIVTYCGGGDCELSRSLAFSLLDAGQHRIAVFTGGLPAWSSGGGDVRKGAQP